MSFNSQNNLLTLTPGPTDFGSFTIEFKAKNFFDGLAASKTSTI
jgi:hypothetical protein